MQRHELSGKSVDSLVNGHSSLDRNAKDSSPRTGPTYLVFGLILLGFGMRIFWLDKQELWFDETASVFIATKTIPEIISYIQGQFLEHPPVYYILLHEWIYFAGISEFALRYFSVFFGVAFLALLWVLTKPFVDRTISFTTIFVAAIIPFQIWQSQEARMYTLVACLGALSIFSFNRLLTAKRLRWGLVFALTTAFGTSTHYYFSFLLLAEGAYFLFNLRRMPSVLRKWLPAATVLSLSPLAIWLALSDGPSQAVLQLLQHWAPAFLWYEDIGRLGIESVFGISDAVSATTAEQIGSAIILAVSLAGILLGRAFIGARHSKDRDTVLVLHSLLGFVVVVPALIGLLMPHNIVARYLTFSHAAFYLLIGIGLTSICSKFRLLLLPLLATITIIFAIGSYNIFFIESKGEFGAGAKIIHSIGMPNDAIVLTHPDLWPTVRYYLPNDLSNVYYVPVAAKPVTDQEVKSSMNLINNTRTRIWLGPVNSSTMDPQSKVEKWLLSNAYRALQVWLPGSTSVSLFFQTKSPLKASPVNYDVGSSLGLRGYAISKEEVGPAGGIPVLLVWQPMFDSADDLELVEGLKLVDENDQVWAEMTDPIIVNANQIETRRALYIPQGTPPGSYRVELSVYSASERNNLIFRETTSNQVLGASLRLGEIKVSGPDHRVPTPEKKSPFKSTFNGEIQLLGLETTPGTYRQGDQVTLAMFWQALSKPKHDYSVIFEIIDAKGNSAYEGQFPMTSGSYSPVNWNPGDYIKGLYKIPIPNDLPGGQYSLQIALRDPAPGALATIDGERTEDTLWGLWQQRARITGTSQTLLNLTVVERERDSEVPDVDSHLNANFGDQLALFGYTGLQRESTMGNTLSFTLFWQAIRSISNSYTVFVHLLNSEGKIVAQQDVIPQKGNYPTNLWAAGEFVKDEHEIDLPDDLPPGQYTIAIGVYNSKSLARLPVMNPNGQPGDDKILLPVILIDR